MKTASAILGLILFGLISIGIWELTDYLISKDNTIENPKSVFHRSTEITYFINDSRSEYIKEAEIFHEYAIYHENCTVWCKSTTDTVPMFTTTAFDTVYYIHTIDTIDIDTTITIVLCNDI